MALRSLPRALLQASLSPLRCSHARGRAGPVRALATASAGSDAPVYVIFGATGGIGSELSKLLHASGARVTLVGRDAAKLDALAAALPGVHTQRSANSAAAGEADAAIAGAMERHGRVDGVANCVGSVVLKAAHMTSDAELAAVMETNLGTSFSILRASVKAMTRSGAGGGSIVLCSSAVARFGLPNHEAIAAAKGAVAGLALSAAATYAPQNVRVNVVSPGLVRSQALLARPGEPLYSRLTPPQTRTPMTARITGNEAALKASTEMHALKRIGAWCAAVACRPALTLRATQASPGTRRAPLHSCLTPPTRSSRARTLASTAGSAASSRAKAHGSTAQLGRFVVDLSFALSARRLTNTSFIAHRPSRYNFHSTSPSRRALSAMADDDDDERMAGSDEEEDEESDDDSLDMGDGASDRDLAAMMAVEQSLRAQPSDYALHAQYVALLRRCKLRSRLRGACEAQAALFPLTEQQWRDWIDDEIAAAERCVMKAHEARCWLSTRGACPNPRVPCCARSAEDVDLVEALYERAVRDYLSVPLWASFIEASAFGRNARSVLPDVSDAYRVLCVAVPAHHRRRRRQAARRVRARADCGRAALLAGRHAVCGAAFGGERGAVTGGGGGCRRCRRRRGAEGGGGCCCARARGVPPPAGAAARGPRCDAR